MSTRSEKAAACLAFARRARENSERAAYAVDELRERVAAARRFTRDATARTEELRARIDQLRNVSPGSTP